jgi:hypothetical protein
VMRILMPLSIHWQTFIPCSRKPPECASPAGYNSRRRTPPAAAGGSRPADVIIVA